MSSGANDQANVLQYAAFRGHGWGHVAAYPSWPYVHLTKLFQPSHNCIIPTVKDLSVILWCKIRALIYDLHHVFHNFKSNVPLQRFAWCIAGLVLHLLKPSLNCHLANSLISTLWILFKERLIMLNIGFDKIRPLVRHIGSPCKLIDYLITVEFYTSKTPQFK